MTHLDETTLALTALGEAPDAADAAHLDACPACRDELARLRHTVETARSLDPADMDPPAPPAHVWDAIAAEVGTVSADEPSVEPGIESGVDASESTGGPGATVVDLGSRRGPIRPPRWLSVAAAVLVLVVVIGAVIAVVGSSDSSSGQEIALAAIGDSRASGRAEVVERDGGTALRVDTTGLAPLSDADYELWLMNPDTDSFVSLGAVRPGVRGDHPIPAGVTVETDPYVDISVEPHDGDPTHSTVSVLRGHF